MSSGRDAATPAARHQRRRLRLHDQRRAGEVHARQQVFAAPTLLWISAPGAFADAVLSAFGARFRWVVAEIEDDHRHYDPRSLELAQRYERAVRASDLLISNAQAMIDEFAPLQPQSLRVRNAVDLAPYLAGPNPAVLNQKGPCEPAWLVSIPRPC